MKRVSVNVNLTVVLIIISNVEMMINAGVNAKNWLIKAYITKDLFEILVTNWGCGCYKSCDFSEHLDYKNCECKKRLPDKSVERSSAEECTENIEETRLVEINSTECNSVENKYKHNSCTLYIVLFSIIFTIKLGIGSYFLYFHWYLKTDVTRVNNLMNL